MHKLTITAIFLLSVGTAYAGGLNDPLMHQPVVVEEAARFYAGDNIIPFILLTLLVAAMTGGILIP